jgi:hypothetical protein
LNAQGKAQHVEQFGRALAGFASPDTLFCIAVLGTVGTLYKERKSRALQIGSNGGEILMNCTGHKGAFTIE